jgi:hypothetical protein
VRAEPPQRVGDLDPRGDIIVGSLREVLDRDQRTPRSCQLERLADGDASHPPVEGGGIAQ